MATEPVASDLTAACVAELRARAASHPPALDLAADLEREQRLEHDAETARRYWRRLVATGALPAQDASTLEQLNGELDGRSQSYLARLALLLLRQACEDRPAPPQAVRATLTLPAHTADHPAFPGSASAGNALHDPSPPLASRMALTLLAAPCAPPRLRTSSACAA